MRRTGWTIVVAVCILSTFGAGAAMPQTATDTATVNGRARTDSLRSTLAGVYTEAQAKRGQQTYAGICASCHTPTSHTGETFNQNWNGHPLSDLYLYVSQQMPQDNPGSLNPNDAADVVAFLLKIYAMPMGTDELAPDTVALKKIRIDPPKGPPQ